MIKINRNDKCPCGSGKKYKKCCYLDPVQNAEILRARSIAQTYEELVSILSKPTMIYEMKIDLVRMGPFEMAEDISRIVEIKDKQNLYDLHLIIQYSFEWDYDHMFSFFLGEELFDRDNEYSGNPFGEHCVPSLGKPTKSAIDTELRDLNLEVGFFFWYLFDYGDELVHKVTVKRVREMLPEEEGLPKLIHEIGAAPSQYGTFEE